MTTKQRITHPDVPEPPAETWSNCLVIGDQIFTAGVTARDGATILADDEYGQARAISKTINRDIIFLRLLVSVVPGQ